jgi:hypothetical protein
MSAATWFRKNKSPDAPSAKETAAIVQPAPATVTEAAPATAEPAKLDNVVETASTPGAEKPAEGPSRAARLVEAGRKSSTDLKSQFAALLAPAEPWAKPAGIAAAVVVAGLLGYAGGYGSAEPDSRDELAASRWSEAAQNLRENRDDVARLALELKSVRTALDGLRSERRAGDAPAKQAQLIERSAAETAAKLVKLSEQLDRIEKTQRDPARLGAIVERLERIEKQAQTAAIAPAPTPAPAPAAAPKPVAAAPAPAADVATTGSLPPARPAEAVVDPRKLPAENYTLRDVEDGYALVEGRNGRFFEVAVGMNLPGLGRVEAIERRGRQWVVVTPKGFVAER